MTTTLAETPLHDWHAAHGGRMVEFGGWSMPVQYTSIVEEHTATRQAAGLFDISHMGRIRFDGADAAAFLDSIVTRRVSDLPQDRIRYCLICNDRGGVLDDVLVYHVYDYLHGDRNYRYEMVVNAGNREKIIQWLSQHACLFNVEVIDLTKSTAMIAVQGPKALELMKEHADVDVGSMKYYSGVYATVGVEFGLLSRTGYTGEDGFEVIVEAEAAYSLWGTLLDAAQAVGGMEVGLGARDTLRLEAAMPLYGHELTEEITPIQAGLDFAVDLEGREFHGRAALIAARDRPALPCRVGLQSAGRRVPREGYAVYSGETEVGYITSGTFSPTLQRPIAMAYVAPEVSAIGTELTIDIRGSREPAHVVKLPFYRRS